MIGGIIIIDISECSFSFLGYISILKELCSTGVMRYPEISEKIFIINAGWILTTLWSAIKSFIPTRTEQKLKILGSNYYQELSTYLFDDHLRDENMSLLVSALTSNNTTNLTTTSQSSNDPLGIENKCDNVYFVEDAYEIILNEIFQFYQESLSTTTITTTTPTIAFQYPDTEEFLMNALKYIERFPNSKLSNRIDVIQQCLLALQSIENKNS